MSTNRDGLRGVGEIIAAAGVIGSLLLVAYEVRESTKATRAAAFQEIGLAVTEGWIETALNPDLAEVMLRSADSAFVASMTPEQSRMMFAWTVGTLRVYETLFLQVELGLLGPEALETFGFREILISWPPLRLYWPSLKATMDPRFALYIERNFDMSAEGAVWGAPDPWGDEQR